MNPPFPRTTCACAECVACCKRQPGFLAPGDAERITEFLGEPASKYLWASPGAIVMNTATRIAHRIGTITPVFDKKRGRCVFLDDKDQCRIHAVAPFGCAFADTHMSARQGMERSAWALRQIEASEQYNALRKSLPLATHHKPNSYDSK